jgi:hypothetical protein
MSEGPGSILGRVKLATHHQLVQSSRNLHLYVHSPPYVFMAQCLVKHSDNFTVSTRSSVKYGAYSGRGTYNWKYNFYLVPAVALWPFGKGWCSSQLVSVVPFASEREGKYWCEPLL